MKEEEKQELSRKEIIKRIAKEPRLAHEYLFAHRHPNQTPEFHGKVIDLWHNHTIPSLSIQAFRGGAKSTVGCEESTIIMALLGVFKNGIIIGERYDRAVERLDAIKYELENNDKINYLFGDPKGNIWKEGKIELFNGTVIQAFGRGQSIRGAKHRDKRPDYLVGDDIEDEDSVRTEEAKEETASWFYRVVLPAMDQNGYLIRIVGTPLDNDSLMEKLGENDDWLSCRFPVEYVDDEGNRKATWPDRIPLEEIDVIRRRYERMGQLLEYGREYMCEARSGETRQFTDDIIKVVPRARIWEPVFVVYDPARTVDKKKSDHTGKAAFSWIGNELKIWEASGHFWRPSQIVSDMFDANEKYDPVVIGIEKTGLSEWAMEPIRNEMTKRNQIIPIRALEPPRGPDKINFIRGLQPFFASGEATMANECPDLRQQLLNFPIGRIDVPNALAYALKMRPGLPVFEDFCDQHILVDHTFTRGIKTMAVNYEEGVVTGVVYEKVHQGINILSNIVLEGDPQQRCKELIEHGRYTARGDNNLDIYIHPAHYERYSASGLLGAIRKHGCDPRRGGDIIKGRGFIVESLRARREGLPILRVHEKARYVLNGFSAGYAFEYKKVGRGLSDRANPGMYRTLMEGLESAMSVYTASTSAIPEQAPNYRTDKNGKPYLSTMPG